MRGARACTLSRGLAGFADIFLTDSLRRRPRVCRTQARPDLTSDLEIPPGVRALPPSRAVSTKEPSAFPQTPHTRPFLLQTPPVPTAFEVLEVNPFRPARASQSAGILTWNPNPETGASRVADREVGF